LKQLKKVTIQDACCANVSVFIVDSIINNWRKIARGRKQKVEEKIKLLNFKTNLLSRVLSLGFQYSIAYLISKVASTNSSFGNIYCT
jgi:DNA-binding LacI/PurR family transcriptional regulator